MKIEFIFGVSFIIFILIGYFYDWMAATAIGTFIMAIATFWSLFQNRKREEKTKHREISEKIITRLIENVEKILTNLQNFEGNGPRWQELEWGPLRYLFYQLDISIRKNIENFQKELENFNKLYIRRKEHIGDIVVGKLSIKSEVKKILSEEDFYWIKQYPFRLSYRVELDYDYGTLYSSNLIRNFIFSLSHISLWRLLLENKPLSQYINGLLEKIKQEINSAEIKIKKEIFFITYNKSTEYLGRKETEEIFNAILDEVLKCPKCKNLVERAKNLLKEAEDLKKKLETFIRIQ